MKLIILLLFLTILTSCEENLKYNCIDEQPTETIKFSEVQEIFNNNCTSCHNTQTKSLFADLDLSGDSYSKIVNVLSTQRTNEFLIKEFSLDSSYLYRKIIGQNIEKAKMPTDKDLNQININKIKLWIEQGAKND